MAATFRSKTEGTNTSATTFTFDVPAGTVEGDFLFAEFALDIQAPTGVALTGGSDWTLFDNPSCTGDGGSIWYYYKIAGASEPSTYQFTYTGAATRCAYACAAYEGVDTTTPIAASLVTNPNLGTPPSSPVSMAASAITTTADNQTVIYGGFVDWNSSTACAFTAPTELGGFTERAKQTPSSFVNCVLYEGTKTIAGSTGTVTATGTLSGASGNYIAALVALTDAVAFSGQTSYPNADGTDGAWTPSTGADLYAVIDDDTDTEYITTSSNSTCRGGMGALDTPVAGTQTFAFRASGSPAKKLIATLIEGASTSRGTLTVDPLTSTPTGYSFEPSGISNYADLDWQFEVADATSPPANTVSYVGADAAFQYDNATSPLAVTYPTTTVSGEKLLLFIGQKPSTANGGTVDASAFGTLVGSLTGANDGNTGGYGTTLGADTGNVNIYCYERDADGTEGGTSFNLTHTQNNVLWTRIIRASNPYGAWAATTYTTGKDTSGGTSVSIAGAADPGFTTGDLAVVAFAIPTDVTTPSQFSAESLSASGATFGSITEVGEPDSSTGNDIGGLLCYGSVTAGTSTGAPTFTATAGGTTTNVRGPAIIVRLRGATPTEFGRVYTTKLTIPEAAASGTTLTPTTGHATATGYAPTLTRTDNQTVAPTTGHPAFTGYAPTIAQAQTVSPVTGHAVFAGYVPTVTRTDHRTVAPATGNVVFAGYAPTVTSTDHHTVAPATGHAAFAGYAPTVTRTDHHTVAPSTGHAAFTGYAPTVSQSVTTTVAPSTGHALLTGYVTVVSRTDHHTVEPTTGHAAVTGYAPTVSQSSSTAVSPSTGHVAFAGYAPTIAQSDHRTVAPVDGHVTLTGYVPSLAQSDHHTVVPSTGHALFSGYAPTVSQTTGTVITPIEGHAVLGGYAPVISQSDHHTLSPTTGSIVVTGYVPVVTIASTTTLSQADIQAIIAAVWSQQLPLGTAPNVTYGTANLNQADLDAIAYGVWSKTLP